VLVLKIVGVKEGVDVRVKVTVDVHEGVLLKTGVGVRVGLKVTVLV
jgi:hypothetical protein